MCMARLFEIDRCCEIHTSRTLKVGSLRQTYILGLQYMINSVFFALRTEDLRKVCHSTSHAMDYAMNARRM